jgi:hypothetical protein
MAAPRRDVITGSLPMYRFDPLTGFWGIPNAVRDIAFEGDNGPVIHICNNSRGNRDKEFSSSNGIKNFLCLGGSHTWGAFVKDEERYSNILSRQTGFNFINLGHPSLGLDQICITLTEKSSRYCPEGIVVEQYPWAFHRVLTSFVNGYLKPNFKIDGAGELHIRRVSPLARFKVYRNVVGAYHALRKELSEFKNDIDIKSAYDPLTDPVFLLWKQKYYDYGYELFGRIAKRMSEYCVLNKIKFLLFLTAHQQQFLGPSKSDLIDYHLPLRRLRSVLSHYQVPFVELAPVLLKENASGKRVIMPDGHLNAHGHAVVARELKNELAKREWF